MFWTYIRNFSGWPGFVNKVDWVWPVNGWRISADDTGKFGAGSSLNDHHVYAWTSKGFSTNTWYFIATVYDGDNDRIKIYVNGTLEGETVWTDNMAITAEGIILGATDGVEPGAFLNGKIDELAIYNRVLTADEIYAAFKGGPTPLVEGSYTISYKSVDKVSNEEVPKDTGVFLDNIPPKIVISSPIGREIFYTNTVNISFEVTDNVKVNDATIKAYFTLVDYADGTKIGEKYPVENGHSYQLFGPCLPYEGYYTLTVESTDMLNNSSLLTTEKFGVSYDIQPPRTLVSIGEPKHETESLTYVTSNTSFTATAYDDKVEIGDGQGLGVKYTEYRIDDGNYVAETGRLFMLRTIDPSCLGLWHFDKGTGTIVTDSVGNNNGTLKGGLGWTEEGKYGPALSFDGVNDVVVMNNPRMFATEMNEFTFELWFNMEEGGPGSHVTFIFTLNQIDIKWAFRYYIEYRVWHPDNSYTELNYYPPNLQAMYNTWHHLAVTYKRGQEQVIWLDGVKVASLLPPDKPVNAGPGVFRVGCDSWDYYKGRMDEMAVYGRAFTDNEIYNRFSNPPSYYTEEIAESSHTVYYRSVDNAGNTESDKSKSVVLDNTPPLITINSPIGGEIFVLGVATIAISYSVTDNFDLTPASYAYLTYEDNTTILPVSNGQEIKPSDLNAGFWTFTVESQDFLNNSISSTTTKFRIIHDIQPPITTLIIGDPKYITEISTYVTSLTSFTLSATDNISGVDYTEYRIDEGEYVIYNRPFALTVIDPSCIDVWHFDESEDNTVFDSVGNNNGTLQGGVNWATGVLGNAVDLDGIDDHIRIADSASLDIADSKTTVMFWTYIRNFSG